MLLAIDIGNTNIVFAVFDGEDIAQTLRIETDVARDADGYKNILADLPLKEIEGVIVSSVVPDAEKGLIEFCESIWGDEPLFVNAKLAKIQVDLDYPGEIGADRLVNARAMIEFYQTPAIVIDFGTATTFDVINGDKHYIGGAIAPGINLSLETLSRAAARLPEIIVDKPERVIGRNTREAMQSGIYWGYIGLIEAIVENITQELGVTPFVLATGGLAPLYAESTDIIEVVDQALTLKGLCRIYQSHALS